MSFDTELRLLCFFTPPWVQLYLRVVGMTRDRPEVLWQTQGFQGIFMVGTRELLG